MSMHQAGSVDLDHYYKDYPLKAHTLNFQNWAGYHNRLRLLKRHGLRKGHTVLEYGCGAGVFLKFLQARGYRCSGYDKFVEEYSDESVLRQRYDVIVAYDVIEHDPSPASFLKTVAGLLANDGLLVIATPNTAELSLRDSTNPHLHMPYHLHMLSEQALIDLAAEQGFSPVEVYRRWYYDTLWPFVNGRFIETYIRENGNVIDLAVEEPKIGKVMSSPALMFFGLFGYFFRGRGHMTVCFRRS
jgi:SAM-dependent methyltransferase